MQKTENRIRRQIKKQRCTNPDKCPGILWNSMISPFTNMSIWGAIWYQGERNSFAPANYNCTFPALIRDWRRKWFSGTGGHVKEEFPFGFVQVDSCSTGAIEKHVTRLGGRGVGQIDDKVWHRGEEDWVKEWCHSLENISFQKLHFDWQTSLNNTIYWHFVVVGHLINQFMNRICTIQQMWDLRFISYLDSSLTQSLSPFGVWRGGVGPKTKMQSVKWGGGQGIVISHKS